MRLAGIILSISNFNRSEFSLLAIARGRQRFGIDDDTVLIVYAVTNDLDDRDIDNPNHVDYYAGSEKWALFEFLQALRDVQQMGAKIMGVVRQKPGLNDRAPFIRGMIDLVCPGG